MKLQLAAQQGDRRLELMCRIGEKPLLCTEGHLQACQDFVECYDQRTDFSRQWIHRNPGRQVVLPYGLRSLTGQTDRMQDTAHTPVAQHRQHADRQCGHDAHGLCNGRGDSLLGQLGKSVTSTDLNPVILSLNPMPHGSDVKGCAVDRGAHVVTILLIRGDAG